MGKNKGKGKERRSLSETDREKEQELVRLSRLVADQDNTIRDLQQQIQVLKQTMQKMETVRVAHKQTYERRIQARVEAAHRLGDEKEMFRKLYEEAKDSSYLLVSLFLGFRKFLSEMGTIVLPPINMSGYRVARAEAADILVATYKSLPNVVLRDRRFKLLTGPQDGMLDRRRSGGRSAKGSASDEGSVSLSTEKVSTNPFDEKE